MIVFILPLILLVYPCYAENENDNAFYLDLSYAFTGFSNHGCGFGVTYEKRVMDFLSVEGNLGHMTFLTGIKDVYNTSVSLSLFVNCYPLNNGLDKLYLGIGNGCYFMNYFGRGILPPTASDTLIHITPQLGWKFHISRFLMIDISAGHKFIIMNTRNYKQIKNYINAGFQFGFDFMIYFDMKKKDENGS